MTSIHWVANIATSFNYQMGKKKEKTEISNSIDWNIVHSFRKTAVGIAFGSNTILTDNPSVSLGHMETTGQSRLSTGPVRIIFDRRGRITEDYKVIQNADQFETVLVCERDRGFENIHLIRTGDLTHSINKIENYLVSKGMEGSILVEGGPTLLKSFIEAGLLQKLRIFRRLYNINKGNDIHDFIDLNKFQLLWSNGLGSGIEEIYAMADNSS